MQENARVFLKGLVIYCLFFGPVPLLYGMDGPQSVDLDVLANLYGPVSFDHDMHTEVAVCAVCHHHTTGDPPEEPACLHCHRNSGPTDEVACSSCHDPVVVGARLIKGVTAEEGVFHLEETGLKRAYHVKCLGCHIASGAPVGCEDCHPRAVE